MKRLVFLSYMAFLFSAIVSKPVFAALIQPIGGTLEAIASASIYSSEKVTNTESISLGSGYETKTVTSSAVSGPYYDFNEFSTADITISMLASKDRIDITSASVVKGAHIGPGVHCCASAFSSANVEFLLTTPSAIRLDFSNISAAESASASLVGTNGTVWDFTVQDWWSERKIQEDIFLSAGSYEIIFSTSNTGNLAIYGASTTDHNSFSIAVVPIPTPLWLFASSLVGLIGFARRRRPKLRNRIFEQAFALEVDHAAVFLLFGLKPHRLKKPILFFQAENDYDLSPTKD